MKVACDVKGTLMGDKQTQVLKILDVLSRAGYEVTVWSNLYSYATDAVEELNLKAEAYSKRSKSDFGFDESQYFDIAIEDDRSQTYLAAKQFIFVDDIPEDMAQVELFVKELLEGQ